MVRRESTGVTEPARQQDVETGNPRAGFKMFRVAGTVGGGGDEKST